MAGRRRLSGGDTRTARFGVYLDRTTRERLVIQAIKEREGDVARGRPLFTSADKVTVEELTALVVRDYELNGKRSVGKTKKNVERLADHFAGWRAVNITAATVGAYIEKRLKAGLANGSVNRE